MHVLGFEVLGTWYLGIKVDFNQSCVKMPVINFIMEVHQQINVPSIYKFTYFSVASICSQECIVFKCNSDISWLSLLLELCWRTLVIVTVQLSYVVLSLLQFIPSSLHDLVENTKNGGYWTKKQPKNLKYCTKQLLIKETYNTWC